MHTILHTGLPLEEAQKKITLADAKSEFCAGREFQSWCADSFENNFVIPAVARSYQEKKKRSARIRGLSCTRSPPIAPAPTIFVWHKSIDVSMNPYPTAGGGAPDRIELLIGQGLDVRDSASAEGLQIVATFKH
jgi:hypothetical protein